MYAETALLSALPWNPSFDPFLLLLFFLLVLLSFFFFHLGLFFFFHSYFHWSKLCCQQHRDKVELDKASAA